MLSGNVLMVQGQNTLLRYADKKADESNYYEAAKEYEKAFDRKPSYRAAKGAARAYAYLRNYERTHDFWKKATGFDQAGREDWLHYIAAANQAGETTEVMNTLDSLRATGSGMISNLYLDSLRHWYGQQDRTVLNSLDEVNSSSTEFGWTKDSRGNVYFSSDRGGVFDRNKPAVRIDKSYKYYDKKSDWTGRDFLGVYKMDQDGEITSFNVPVPEVFHLADPYFLKDQAVVFYTATRKIKRPKNYEVQPEIFFSRLDETGNAVDFRPLPVNNALGYGVKTPFVDEANKRLYFASDMPGSFGGYDLYVMEYDSDFNFGKPVNIGSSVNTAGNERDPYVHDGRFYFSSDGHIGLGGLDLFVADMKEDKIGHPKNMGVPYNSHQDEFGISISEEGIILASNRPESLGLDDIFKAENIDLRFQALVVDCDGEPIKGEVDFMLQESEKQTNVSVKKEEEANFHAELSPDMDYQVLVKKQGYFTVKDDGLTTKQMVGDRITKTYQLVKIPYNTSVYVDLVYYDLDQAVIRGDAGQILDKVAEVLKSYSFLDITVRSHTDSRASHAYNEVLSEKRANAVRDYLGQFGIARSRVKSEWFGERQLINDCGDGVPCSESLHQLNRRSELLLLAFPDEGKAYEWPGELEGTDLCEISNILITREMPMVHFDFDKSDLNLEAMKTLEKAILMLNHMPIEGLSIEGHTDIRGSEDYNIRLSERRALVVKDYLEGRGIASDRLVYDYFGKSNPIYDCKESPCSPEMHHINRRTALTLPELNKDWRSAMQNK
jgi:outer membrane protein OmpA-like peptidoglycan-associated protein/tetratricopeptide (TPR) repeat protein